MRRRVPFAGRIRRGRSPRRDEVGAGRHFRSRKYHRSPVATGLDLGGHLNRLTDPTVRPGPRGQPVSLPSLDRARTMHHRGPRRVRRRVTLMVTSTVAVDQPVTAQLSGRPRRCQALPVPDHRGKAADRQRTTTPVRWRSAVATGGRARGNRNGPRDGGMARVVGLALWAMSPLGDRVAGAGAGDGTIGTRLNSMRGGW